MSFDFKSYIREVPDYPKVGVSFKDLSPLLASAEGFHEAIAELAKRFAGDNISAIVATEARGFLWGGALAQALRTGLVLVRKPKKLPRETIHVSYALEYGTDELHIHRDALRGGQRVLIVDDVLATGGTVRATVELVTRLEVAIVGLAFVVELEFLEGRKTLSPHPVYSLVKY